MSEKTYLKTFCKKCGGKIEFPDYARGASINCPHCGQETILSVASAAPVAASVAAPATPAPAATAAASAATATATAAAAAATAKPAAARPAAAADAITAAAAAAAAAMDKAKAKAKGSPPPASRSSAASSSSSGSPSKISAALATPLDEIYAEMDKQKKKESCPSCASRIEIGQSVCPSCGAGLVRHVRIIRRYGGLLLVVLIIAFPFLLPRNIKLPIAALEKQKSKFVPPAKPDIEMINPAWSKAKEGNVHFISGLIVNNSTKYRFLGVKVEFELLDKTGNSLGKTVDQLGILEPKKNWTFRAVAIDPDATGFKFIGLTAEKVPAEKPAAAPEKAPAAKAPAEKAPAPKPAGK
ncbi:hypothetical protein LBMAG56_29170 [Verrucomicrobiota bacterium]|nr:hypothetical protein LBMAG56_29170 [Verrucomicrobiota bacterium]